MATQVVRRLYLYAAAFIGLQLTVTGARQVIGALVERVFWPGAIGSTEFDVAWLSYSVALLVVGLPLWGVHWYVAQRGLARPEEQRSTLRRLYGYTILLVAMLGLLFAARRLLLALVGVEDGDGGASVTAAPLAALLVHAAVWGYHWQVFGADRTAVERTGGTATLRRWYLLLVQAFGLGMASYAAADLLHRLLQAALVPAIGDTSSVGAPVAGLIAGLAVWLPHYLWGRQLLRAGVMLREDEAQSTLRQVYAALVVTTTAIAALGAVVVLVAEILLAAFGAAAWRSVLPDHTLALATVLVAVPLWRFHRAQLADEARLSENPARTDTARRIGGYLMAAVGLAALFFGLGGLLSTLLRLALAPEVVGAGWREALSVYLALAMVALPVFGVASGVMERLIRTSAAEERTLARRIYLYAALLFGLIATIIALVALLRLVLSAVLGAAETDLPAELGAWLGYTLIGAAIAFYYGTLLRRAGAVPGDAGLGVTIAVVANDPLLAALATGFARELPGAMVRATRIDDAHGELELDGADVVVVDVAAALDGRLGGAIQAFRGHRLLLATPVSGYEVIGARRGEDALVREAIRTVRTGLNTTPKPGPSPVSAVPAASS